jgi:hypothetical protein
MPLLEPAWRLRSTRQADRVLTCGIYQAFFGVEVRVEFGEDDVVRSELVRSIKHARELAGEFRVAILATNGYVELS